MTSVGADPCVRPEEPVFKRAHTWVRPYRSVFMYFGSSALFAKRASPDILFFLILPDYRDAAHVHEWDSAQIVRKTVPGVF